MGRMIGERLRSQASATWRGEASSSSATLSSEVGGGVRAWPRGAQGMKAMPFFSQ